MAPGLVPDLAPWLPISWLGYVAPGLMAAVAPDLAPPEPGLVAALDPPALVDPKPHRRVSGYATRWLMILPPDGSDLERR